MKGMKKVAQFMQDVKIPGDRRDRVPILADEAGIYGWSATARRKGKNHGAKRKKYCSSNSNGFVTEIFMLPLRLQSIYL